ncbi:AraC family transcriptional regulator [Paenibacillus sp.]|jgi:AraC-like DNA-binding protein|uniref:AraC family transcriptional regulator n=1 Tax=Paenibacillus sp. TaxID=58172 RepID=UPI00281A6947|nr:AraC family transcriptional regulator [Paenibacillus sp.]MDR0267503.1 AraC family transcriptional regulator [Paenibacillus sp.]
MERPLSLQEPMDMPDRFFPIKVHHCVTKEYGRTLFTHHWHDHIEILYFTKGSALVEINSVPYEVGEGDLVVLNAKDLHFGVSQCDDLIYYAMIVDINLLHSHSVDAIETKFITPISQNQILFESKICGDKKIVSCISSLIQELNHQELGYELSIKSYLYRILTILLRRYGTNKMSTEDDQLRLKNLERFTPVFQYIEEHYQEDLTVDLLSGLAGLSRFHFSRLFKELAGRTVTDYINALRINKSEYLLRNSHLNISEIALSTGFKDIYYFSRSFKKYKHVSPSEMRRSFHE